MCSQALQEISRLGPAFSEAKRIWLCRRGVRSAITASSTLLPAMIISAHTWGSSSEIDLLLSNQVIHSSVHILLLSGFPTWVSVGSRRRRWESPRRRPQHRTFGFSSPWTGRGSQESGERQECWESWFWLPFWGVISPGGQNKLWGE